MEPEAVSTWYHWSLVMPSAVISWPVTVSITFTWVSRYKVATVIGGRWWVRCAGARRCR